MYIYITTFGRYVRNIFKPSRKYEITLSTLSVITTRRVRIISQILIRRYQLLNPVNLSFITSTSFANRSA